MTAGDMIEQVPGLTLDKVTYYVRAGYLCPKKVKRRSLFYNEFSKEDCHLLKRAWKYISEQKMRVRAAFELAAKELKDTQLQIPFDLEGKESGGSSRQ